MQREAQSSNDPSATSAESSDEASETSTFLSRSDSFSSLPGWQRCTPGWYFVVFVTHAAATALLFPRDDVDAYEYECHQGHVCTCCRQNFKWQDSWLYCVDGPMAHVDESRCHMDTCSLPEKMSFFVLLLASLGAGFMAAFLMKRAGNSSHVRSACGCATVNWFQSMLGSTSFLNNEDCLYGLLSKMLSRSNVYANVIFVKMMLYLIGLFWMQLLIAERLDLLERTSHQNYCAWCFRKLLQVQFVAVVLAAPLVVLVGSFDEYAIYQAAAYEFLVFPWLCNVLASMVASWSLTQSFLQLRGMVCFSELEEPIAGRARIFAKLQVIGVSMSLVLTLFALPATAWGFIRSERRLEWHHALKVEAAKPFRVLEWLAVFVEALDTLGTGCCDTAVWKLSVA